MDICKTVWTICFIFALAINIGYSSKNKSNFRDLHMSDGCFCKLKGEVDDCSCKVETLDSLNNIKIYPRLQSLITRDYFRYFKVNLNKECPFWEDDSRCAMKNCHVDVCSEDEVPKGLKEDSGGGENKYSEESQSSGCEEDKLGYLNTSLSEESKEAFKNWTEYDDAQENFCELDDDTSSDCHYVDLLLNPERYTGYKGPSAHRIWYSIYKENCFNPEKRPYGKDSLKEHTLEGLCLEKRAFYRMISGLHTSINTHLSAIYLFPATSCYGEEKWGPNLEEFQSRFDPVVGHKEGPQRLKNLYFTYLVELRALAKAAPYLEQEDYYTGNPEDDKDVKQGVIDLLKVIKEFPDHFDESKLFQGNPKESKKLKKEFRNHFLNITRIMDCVGCEKCKLWGKLQTQGMGTALKILFSGDGMGPSSTVTAGSKRMFQLRRTEIVSLVNAFARLSSSIHAIEEFRKMLR